MSVQQKELKVACPLTLLVQRRFIRLFEHKPNEGSDPVTLYCTLFYLYITVESDLLCLSCSESQGHTDRK